MDAPPDPRTPAGAGQQVAALYQAHALGLVNLAKVMLVTSRRPKSRAVMAALRALPARQREAVVLRYYLDLSEDQTAAAMNASRGAVKSATSRGRAALTRMFLWVGSATSAVIQLQTLDPPTIPPPW